MRALNRRRSMSSPPAESGCAGFTLIELLVVLAIVATLAMLVVPRYYQQLDHARETALRNNLHTVREVIEKFYGDTGRYPESLDELVERKYLRSLPVDPVTESTQTWQLVDVPQGYQGKVYDLRSGASGTGTDGKPYAEF